MAQSKKKCSAVVVTQHDNAFHAISAVLKSVFSPIYSASSLAQARQMTAQEPIDVVVINTPASDGFGMEEAAEFVLRDHVCAMVLVKNELYDRAVYQTRGTGVMVLSRPLRSQMLLEAANLMVATQERMAQLTAESARLRKRLQEMSLITRAKCLLIEKKGMKEEEAHYYLEKMAMDQSMTKKEAAEQIIEDLDLM